MLDVKRLLRKALKAQYIEYDQTITANLAALASTSPLNSFGYLTIAPPASVPSSATAELIETNGWGFLARMGSSNNYRFLVPGTTSGSRTIVVRWRWHI